MKRTVLWYAMLVVVAWLLWNEVALVLENVGDNLRHYYLGD